MTKRHLKAVSSAPAHPRRALAYIRVSALMGRGGDDFHSPEMQLGSIRHAITIGAMREVEVVDDDIDQTGRTFERKGVRRIKALVEAGHVDAVVFYDIKRFGRNVLEGLKFAKWLLDHGVTIVSASENIDTSTPSGRLMFTQLLAIGEYQSDEIGRYWQSVRVKRGKAGLWHGRCPTGYVKKDGTLAPHPIEGPAMTAVFAAYAQDVPIGEIVAQLARAVGKRQYTSSVKQRLRLRTYLGEVPVNGEWLPGRHPGLVDQETWDKVQKRLAREKTMASRSLQPTWSMVGLACCPWGHNLQRNRRADMPGGPKVERMICGRRCGGVSYDDRCEGIGSPQLARVEKEVLRQWRERAKLLRTNAAARATQISRKRSAKVDAVTLRAELKRTQGAMTRLTKARMMGDPDLSETLYRDTMGELRAAEESIQDALRGAEAITEQRTPDEMANAAEQLMAMWDRMTYAEKNKALRTQVKKITVRGREYYREHDRHLVSIDWV